MKKCDFYLCLNALNILLLPCMSGLFLAFFITCYFAQSFIAPICMILVCIIVKIFLLYLLFGFCQKKFPKSTMYKVLNELKQNPSSRKSALLLSFGYDVMIIFSFALWQIKEFCFEWSSVLAYEIFTLGGVFMFYVSLFCVWKIQDKLNIRNSK